MLKINTSREVWYPVSVELLDDKRAGKTNKHEIKVKYRLPSRKEIVQRSAEAQAKARAAIVSGLADIADDESYEDWLFEHVLDWDGVADEDDKAIECTPDNLRAVCNAYPVIFTAIDTGLYKAAVDAPVKNS